MIKLTTWERLTISAIVGSMTGTVAEVRRAGKLLDALEFNDEDAKAIGLVADPSGVRWEDETREWEVELDDASLQLARSQVSTWAHFRASERKKVGALVDKLGQ